MFLSYSESKTESLSGPKTLSEGDISIEHQPGHVSQMFDQYCAGIEMKIEYLFPLI